MAVYNTVEGCHLQSDPPSHPPDFVFHDIFGTYDHPAAVANLNAGQHLFAIMRRRS